MNVNGHWYTSGFIQMWRDRASTGAPILTDFARNWAYDARWGPMNHYQPHVGELMGFFVSAGDARNWGSVTSVRERSNVVAVNLPANDTGVFTFPDRPVTRTLLAGDFNVDTKPDLIAQEQNGRVTLALSAGTTFSQLQSPYNNVVTPWNIAGVGDFNNDGKPDLVWQNTAGSIATWLNNGSSAPIPVNLYTGASTWRIAAVADMDQDGTSDLIWQSPTGAAVIWFMHGTTVFRVQQIWSGVSNWRIVGADDFNGDGDPDIVWQGPAGNAIAWIMHGAVQAGSLTVYGAGSMWRIVSVGDINGDSHPDLLWLSPTGQVVVWIMNRTTIVQGKFVKSTATGWMLSDTP